MKDQTGDNGIKDVEIMVPLKYLSYFCRTLEMPLTSYQLNFILIWSANLIMVSSNNSNQGATFSIAEVKLYVLVVTLSTQDNAKLSQQIKSGFKKTIKQNKYMSKPELLRQNGNLNHLVESFFQEINRLFVLLFEGDAQWTSSKRNYFPKVEIKGYNVMIDGKNFSSGSKK